MDFFQLIRIEFYIFFDFLGRIVKKRRRSQKKGFELQNGPQKCRPQEFFGPYFGHQIRRKVAKVVIRKITKKTTLLEILFLVQFAVF